MSITKRAPSLSNGGGRRTAKMASNAARAVMSFLPAVDETRMGAFFLLSIWFLTMVANKTLRRSSGTTFRVDGSRSANGRLRAALHAKCSVAQKYTKTTFFHSLDFVEQTRLHSLGKSLPLSLTTFRITISKIYRYIYPCFKLHNHTCFQ